MSSTSSERLLSRLTHRILLSPAHFVLAEPLAEPTQLLQQLPSGRLLEKLYLLDLLSRGHVQKLSLGV